jgi:hypothetical protein
MALNKLEGMVERYKNYKKNFFEQTSIRWASRVVRPAVGVARWAGSVVGGASCV